MVRTEYGPDWTRALELEVEDGRKKGRLRRTQKKPVDEESMAVDLSL